MSDEDYLIQLLEQRENKVNRESEEYMVHIASTSLDGEELSTLFPWGDFFQ